MDKGADSYYRFLDGDESGLYELIRDHKDGLILYINSIVSDMHTAEELAEDTFVKIFLKRPGYSRSGSFKTWLYTIGKNLAVMADIGMETTQLAVDRLRREKRNPSVSLELCQEQADGSAEIERAFLQQEQKITLYHALSRIRVEYRQVLWLTYFEGFDHRQAAEIMKKTVHSVDTLVYRAKKALKTELEKEGFEYEKF